MVLVIENIDEANIDLLNADGVTTPDGKPFYDLRNVMTAEALGAGEQTADITLLLNNTERRCFTLEVQLYEQNLTESVPLGKPVKSFAIALDPLPAEYALEVNRPNPFNSQTQIAYQLPEPGLVSLIIYNALGQPVRKLVQGEQQAGFYEVVWNGLNSQGQSVGTGLYFYRLVSHKFTQTRRMLLLK